MFVFFCQSCLLLALTGTICFLLPLVTSSGHFWHLANATIYFPLSLWICKYCCHSCVHLHCSIYGIFFTFHLYIFYYIILQYVGGSNCSCTLLIFYLTCLSMLLATDFLKSKCTAKHVNEAVRLSLHSLLVG